MAKAETTFSDAKLLAENKRWNSSLNRLYYAALLNKMDIRTKTHSGVKTLFHQTFVKQGIIDKPLANHYSYLFERRGEADYGDFETVTEDELLPLIDKTEVFILMLKKLTNR